MPQVRLMEGEDSPSDVTEARRQCTGDRGCVDNDEAMSTTP
jgi:hypothetical protein